MYGSEAYYSNTVELYRHIFDVDLGNSGFEYVLGRPTYDYLMMLVIGTGWRLLAFFGLVLINRDKQK